MLACAAQPKKQGSEGCSPPPQLVKQAFPPPELHSCSQVSTVRTELPRAQHAQGPTFRGRHIHPMRGTVITLL